MIVTACSTALFATTFTAADAITTINIVGTVATFLTTLKNETIFIMKINIHTMMTINK